MENTNSLSDIYDLDFVNSQKELLNIESQIQSDNVTANSEIPKEVNNDTFERAISLVIPIKNAQFVTLETEETASCSKVSETDTQVKSKNKE